MHPVACLEHLDVVFAQPVVLLLKHSAYCGLSRWAWDEVAAVASQTEVPVYILEVPYRRALADEVARRTAVRHESPQVLLLRQGTVVAQASHWAVTASFLRNKLEVSSAAPLHRRGF